MKITKSDIFVRMNGKVVDLAGPGEEKLVLMGRGAGRGEGVTPPLDIYNVFFL